MFEEVLGAFTASFFFFTLRGWGLRGWGGGFEWLMFEGTVRSSHGSDFVRVVRGDVRVVRAKSPGCPGQSPRAKVRVVRAKVRVVRAACPGCPGQKSGLSGPKSGLSGPKSGLSGPKSGLSGPHVRAVPATCPG